MFVAQKSVMGFICLSGKDLNQAPKYRKLVILDRFCLRRSTKNQNVQLRNKHMSKSAVACSKYITAMLIFSPIMSVTFHLYSISINKRCIPIHILYLCTLPFCSINSESSVFTPKFPTSKRALQKPRRYTCLTRKLKCGMMDTLSIQWSQH